MSVLPGIGLVFIIVLIAGFVAYIGDRVGHQVGRRRLTLFGLRPKYTSTIVAVATGMLIALTVTLAALAASSYVRTAFFRLDQLNSQINTLQAQALSQASELNNIRNTALVLPKRQLIANIAGTLDLGIPENEQLRQLGAFFDQAVSIANQQLTKPPFSLKPYAKKSKDPEVQAGLRSELLTIKQQAISKEGSARGNIVLLLPIAATNLFRGDQITFYLSHYIDTKIAGAGEMLASQVVDGGAPVNLTGLIANASLELGKRGMPGPFLLNPGYNAPQVQNVLGQLSRLRGKYRLSAKASYDIYPHSGAVVYDFALAPSR
ncbi:MAG: hypothetical protein NVS2B17_22180 [Candidatus Velthaea sp.]